MLPIELIFTGDENKYFMSDNAPILNAAPSPPPAITGTMLAPTPADEPPVEFATVTVTVLVFVVKNPLPPYVIVKYVSPRAVLFKIVPVPSVTRFAIALDVPLPKII